jgi:hypothetical protein
VGELRREEASDLGLGLVRRREQPRGLRGSLEGDGEITRGREPGGGLPSQRLHRDIRERLRHRGGARIGPLDGASEDLEQHGDIRLCPEEAVVDQRLPEHDAHREHVRARVARCSASLLRGHVAGLALEHSGVRSRHPRGRERDPEVCDAAEAVDPHDHILR